MSLEFIETENSYLVVQKIMGFTSTDTMTVRYKKDLSMCRVNDDPWRQTYKNQVDWFEKYYRNKFN